MCSGNLIATEMIPVVQLNEIFRQSMQSLIVTNAHKIVAGQMPDLHIKSSDFFFFLIMMEKSFPMF